MKESLIQEWKIDPENKPSEGWIDLIYNFYEDGQHWAKAGVKFDGCVNLRIAYNSPFPKKDFDEEQQIHICDIDGMIKKLTLLKEEAKKHFGEDWG